MKQSYLAVFLLIPLFSCGGNTSDKLGRYDVTKNKEETNSFTISFISEPEDTFEDSYQIFFERAKNVCAEKELLIHAFMSDTHNSSNMMHVAGTNFYTSVPNSKRHAFGMFYCNPTDTQKEKVAQRQEKTQQECTEFKKKNPESLSQIEIRFIDYCDSLKASGVY